MVAYKILRKRKNGTLGPLFIERRRVIKETVWEEAHDVPTKGYAHRMGWHACEEPKAPHLKLNDDRDWYAVELDGWVERHVRPTSQGGVWFTAEKMRVIATLEDYLNSIGFCCN